MNYRDTLCINELGHLSVGGVDTLCLKEKFGSPLYVLDVEYVLNIARKLKNTLETCYGDGKVLYASKALSTSAIYSLLHKEGLGADVVSGGELYSALNGKMPSDSLYFHGNNKSYSEIVYAIKSGVHAVVIDGDDELLFINEIIRKEGFSSVPVMLRVNPGVEAHTHEFIQTAKTDSKFGVSIADNTAIKLVGKILSSEKLNFLGITCHIGSQIFEHAPFVAAAIKMVEFIKNINTTYSLEVEELDLGGGFGVYYTDEDEKFTLDDYDSYLTEVIRGLNCAIEEFGVKKPYLTIEPGRSIVGEAGITLYTVGNIKTIPSVRKYVSVDGGMFENPRYALYKAKYSCVICDRANEKADDLVTITGKCCESGDMIAKDVLIQSPKRGDTLATFSTGAYNYSMASNYNRNLIPPMVAVYRGKAEYIVKPQSYDDLVRNDVTPCFFEDKL